MASTGLQVNNCSRQLGASSGCGDATLQTQDLGGKGRRVRVQVHLCSRFTSAIVIKHSEQTNLGEKRVYVNRLQEMSEQDPDSETRQQVCSLVRWQPHAYPERRQPSLQSSGFAGTVLPLMNVVLQKLTVKTTPDVYALRLIWTRWLSRVTMGCVQLTIKFKQDTGLSG